MTSNPFSAGDRKALGVLALLLAAGLFFNFYQKGRQTVTPAFVLSSVELPAGYFSESVLPPAPKIPEWPLDLNRATARELETLPSVGPAMAARIIAYREKTGGFKKIEELMNVSGIGPKKLAQMKPKLEIGPFAAASKNLPMASNARPFGEKQ